MVVIASSLKEIVSREEKIHHRLYNGLAKEITECIANVVKECNAEHNREVSCIKEIAKKVSVDVAFLKWIYGGLFALIGLAWLIVQAVERVVHGGGHL